MGEHFAMGLLVEFFQRQVGNLEGFTLSAESGISQTRATLFNSGALAATAALRALVTARFKLVFHAGARARIRLAAGARVFAVTELTTAPKRCGLGLAHAGAVVAAHGDHGLGCGFGRGRCRGRLSFGGGFFGHDFCEGCDFFTYSSGFGCGFRDSFSSAVGLSNGCGSLVSGGRSNFRGSFG